MSARSSATRWRMPREKLPTGIVGAVVEAGPLERRTCAAARWYGDPIEAREERQVLARRQLRIQEQVVAQHADPFAQRWRRRPAFDALP